MDLRFDRRLTRTAGIDKTRNIKGDAFGVSPFSLDGPMHQESLLEKLRSEVDKCLWKDLIPHAARGHVVIVDPYLDFLEVAVAIAEDASPKVSEWMQAGQLGRSTDDHLKLWNEMPDKAFQMVVVAPYVLVQEILAS